MVLMTTNTKIITPSDIDLTANFLDASGENALWRKYAGFAATPENIARQSFEDPDFAPELFLGLLEGGKMTACGLGIRRPWKSPSTGFIKWLTGKPETAAMLLKELEKRLAANSATELAFGSSSPIYVFAGIPEENRGLRGVLEKHGWSGGSERISLKADCIFLPPENSAFKNGGSISLATSSDSAELAAFIRREFSESWAREAAVDGDGFVMILRDSRDGIIGFAAMGTMNPGWFGPMGVAKHLRGNGYGSALVRATINEAAKRGIPHALLQWINDKEPFYKKLLPNSERLIMLKQSKNIRTCNALRLTSSTMTTPSAPKPAAIPAPPLNSSK